MGAFGLPDPVFRPAREGSPVFSSLLTFIVLFKVY